MGDIGVEPEATVEIKGRATPVERSTASFDAPHPGDQAA
jgi:hypothetical protein